MIKRLRRRFIFAAMLAMSLVLFVIIAATNFYVTLKADGEVESTQMNDMISIGSDKASSMARKIVKAKKQRGFCSYFRYLIYNSASGEKVVCFLDCQRSLSNARSFLLISIAASLAGEAAVFALILFFSERIVVPIEESYQKQRRFITDAGHELKTPITIIDADIAVLESEKGEDETVASFMSRARIMEKTISYKK
ncbi:MAG: hypothetical protein ACI4CX_05280 [Candidatus Weimeria sp.]